ncbi:sensor histidine kinase [Amycolatopsis sp. BJA-103]|uniref:sensor histidine kinase n=1 Tax=Amycolatopsis sp. BJA-103 TaxID=1911175 RepID=UPI000C7816C6|nr:histidine kinase [Amycolatopsis sp. BJA-103]AUI59612.1 two-component sensor histidine kinase [Amycolatopsis sp. BJA-103]PNE16940.1 two-component sensor histidine kinase [Amycolatopsis sp. BJA-103]
MFGERLDSWLRGNESLVDVVTALLLSACCVLFGLFVRADTAYFLFSLFLPLPLALRRRKPAVCAALVLGVAGVQWLTVRDTHGALLADLAVPVAVHAATAYGPRWAGRAGLAVGLFGAVLGGLSWPLLPSSPTAHALVGAFLASTVVAAWAIGALWRVRRAERDQRARLAVLAERTRIAREMHDILAHSLAVVIAQADGGRYAAVSSPEAGRAALATIGDCGRQALGELRRVLGVLRDGPETAEPQPGLDDLPGLVDRVRAGGLDVRLAFETPPGPVEPGFSLTGYRIVQEGLTNVLKHAGTGARAEVSVRWPAGRLEIDVLDDGRARIAGPGGGHGLVGMRERAGAYRGTVTLEPRPGGGHVLRARLPVPA